MRSINDIQNTEMVDLLNKCWMTHDGMWFFHCLQAFGIEATNQINKSAIRSLAPIEIERLTNVLGYPQRIGNYEEFESFFKSAADLMIPDFMNVIFRFPGENTVSWEFNQRKCFAYKGIKRLGVIDKYECGVLYRIQCWLEALGIRHSFSPKVNRCLMHRDGACRGQIRLFQ